MILDICQWWLDEKLQRSTAARDRVLELEGKRLGIALTGTGFAVVVAASGGGLELAGLSSDGAELPEGLGDCDAVLAASLLNLVALSQSTGLSDFKRSEARLSGQLHVAESFGTVFDLLQPDLEAELADWVGDLAARQISVAARDISAWLKRAHAAIEQDTAEYLKEENELLAQPLDVARFGDEVERLRDDVERAGKRIDILVRRLAPEH